MFFTQLFLLALLASSTAFDSFFDMDPSHKHDATKAPTPPTKHAAIATPKHKPPPPKPKLEMETIKLSPPVFPKFRSIKDIKSYQPDQNRPVYLGVMLEQFASSRMPDGDGKAAKDNVRLFISDWFRRNNLHMEDHTFKMRIKEGDQPMDFTGANLIGFIPGRFANTTRDNVLLIAAHYDTGEVIHGIADNGAGVVALMETARIINHLIQNGSLVLDRTVVFAALDFQLSEYPASADYEIYGEDGTQHYLKYVKQKFLTNNPIPRLTGIFLDSILMYNGKQNTQTTIPGLREELPDEYNSIRNSGNVGNFLSMISMNTGGTSQIEQAVKTYWEHAKTGRPERQDFKLRSWPLNSMNASTELNRAFNKQGQQHFWFYRGTNNSRTVLPIPAILLTDTGSHYRTDVGICRPNCTNLETRFPNQIHFLATTIDTLVKTIIHQQGGSYSSSTTDSTVTTSGATNVMSSVTMMIFTALLSTLLAGM